MAKFDYYNSASRRKYYARKLFSGTTFWLLTAFNLIIVIFAVLIFLRAEVKCIGFAQIILGLALMFESYILAKRYSEPKEKSKENIVDRFSLELINLFEVAIDEARKLKESEITPEHVFGSFPLTNEGRMIFLRIGLPFGKKSEGKSSGEMPSFSADFSKLFTEDSLKEIEIEDFLAAVGVSSSKIQGLLEDVKITAKDLEKILSWLKTTKKELKAPKFWQDEKMFAGVGQDWSYGYTPILSLFSYDLSQYAHDPGLDINIFSHANKLNEIQIILAKNNKNNCLLVGEPGVGKKTIVNALALKMARGDCLPPLKYKRLRQLDVGKLLAGAGPGELEARLEGSLDDAVRAGNIILFIENFQILLGGFTSGKEEIIGVDASQILIPYLENSTLRIIAAVSPSDYFDSVRSNTGIASAFEKIEIAPATPDETLAIMLESLLYIEAKYNVFIPFETMKKIVELADRYIRDVPFPEKALRLLEEASVNYTGGKIKIITPEDIEVLISKKVNIPIGEAGKEEKDKLLNLESFLHQRVIDQEEAITAISNTLRRARAGIASGKRPVGVFLFLGPTGVGKTETAKALAENYFGNEKNMIRLDMSEYQDANSIDRLIGTVDNPNGILNTAVYENPFSLVLLDELEKADKNILNVFLQVFEDGRLTDPRGRISDFTNTIIIATSNAGSEYIRENVGKIPQEKLKEDLINMLQEKGIYSPEFLNRFDGVIVFNPLNPDQIKQVAQLMIKKINDGLKDKKILVEVNDQALEKLVQLGYDPQFGARPMRRVIQEKIENLLAKKMLSNELQQGQTLKITPEDI